MCEQSHRLFCSDVDVDDNGSTEVPYHGWIKVMGSSGIHEAQSDPNHPPIPDTAHPLGVCHFGGVSKVKIAVP